MSDQLDDFIAELQESILNETRAAYGEAVYERWLNPLYKGRLEDPDGFARLTGHCGDTMMIFLRFHEDVVVDAAFETDGCGASVVCGSVAAEMALHKSPDQLLEISGASILDRLGGLPESERHCAYLAGETLQEALNEYMKKGAEGKGNR
jgi:nitrogen fixation NifU-like protein